MNFFQVAVDIARTTGRCPSARDIVVRLDSLTYLYKFSNKIILDLILDLLLFQKRRPCSSPLPPMIRFVWIAAFCACGALRSATAMRTNLANETATNLGTDHRAGKTVSISNSLWKGLRKSIHYSIGDVVRK